jgi:hypothetical protein
VIRAITLCVLFAHGCGASLPDAATVRARANELRTELNAVSDEVREVYVSARLLCELDAPESAEPCEALESAAPAINDAFSAAGYVIDGAELGASTFEQAQAALEKLRALVGEAGKLAEKVKAHVAP